MFARFRKVNYWADIGETEGFHEAIEKLGLNWRLLNEPEQGYTDANSIWGQLANNTRLKNKDTYDARKWLYNAWTQNRQEVRTTFFAKMDFGQSPTLEVSSEENAKSQPDISNSKKAEMLPAISSDSSFKSKDSDVRPVRKKQIERPRRILHFALNCDEWRQFYDYKTGRNTTDWSNQLAKYMPRVGLTCSVAFKRHHLKQQGSRKKNCNFFSCSGRCTISLCPIMLSIVIEAEPKTKTSPAVFTVYVFGDANHDRQKATGSRPLRGLERSIIAQQVHKEGPLAVYEELLRRADDNLLHDGNLTQAPSTDVLKTVVYEYNNKYRLDEDMFKEIRIFREITERWDETSKKVKGYVQKTGEWPFEVHFFTESQINCFIRYCKRKTYSYLHIDATGSVVRRFKNQNQIYFYTMVYTDDVVNSLLPASGALLSDHTTASITAYFNNFRGKVGLLSKVARPSFVVIDFSPALLNSVLASFNFENVHNHLRRCSNAIDRAYSTSQLKDMTFVRLCCAHVIKAFCRSAYKLEGSRNTRRKMISLFVVLLNTSNLNGAYDLYQHIMAIYADPYNEKSSDQLDFLLNTNHSNNDDFEKYLDEKPDDEDPHFLDEIDIGKDAIIHQSPFNVKACARIPFINQIIQKEKLDKQTTNQLYAPKVVQLFHKWFAYLPLWSCIMTDFIDRYASDGMQLSDDDWEFGFGRVSNASVESYFSIVKQSVLQKRTRLRPMAFLMEMYFHTQSRFKAEKYEVPQYSRNRKSKQDNEHFLNTEDTWSRRSRSQSVGSRRSTYISDSASETQAFKISSKKMNKKSDKLSQASSDVESTPFISNAESNANDTNNSLTDSESSSDDSFHFSNKSSSQKTDQSGTFLVTDTNPLPSSLTATDLPIISEDSTEIDPIKITLTMESTDTDTTETSDSVRRSSRKRIPNRKYTTDYISPTISPEVSPIIPPKRSHSPSTKSASSSFKTPTPVQKVRKKSKHSPLNSPSYQQTMTNKKHRFTTVGNIQLPWPRFGIRSAIFEGRVYSVTNTCPLDTGLFILFYAYKSGTSEFQALFQRETIEIYRVIRQTFQLIDIEDWNVARLYWLTTLNLLENDDKIRVHDIENTLTEIVFGFIRLMQEHQIKSKCSCDVCPKQNRSNTNRIIEFSKVDGHYPDILPAFATDQIVSCGVTLGPQEPIDYPAQYWFDDHFPIYDVETNTKTITSRYICKADRTIYISHFTYPSPPFLILSVEKSRPFISQIPNTLQAGPYEYRLIAGTNNTNRHFTAIIKTNDDRYFRFNDINPLGCFPFDGTVQVDFVIYALNI